MDAIIAAVTAFFRGANKPSVTILEAVVAWGVDYHKSLYYLAQDGRAGYAMKGDAILKLVDILNAHDGSKVAVEEFDPRAATNKALADENAQLRAKLDAAGIETDF